MNRQLIQSGCSAFRKILLFSLFASLLVHDTASAQLRPSTDAPPPVRIVMGSKTSSTARHFDGVRYLALTYTEVRAQPNLASPILSDIGRWHLVYAKPASTPGWLEVTGSGSRIYPDLYSGHGENIVDVDAEGRLALPDAPVDRDDYVPLSGFVQASHLAPAEVSETPPLADVISLPSLWSGLGVTERRFIPKRALEHPFSAVAILQFTPSRPKQREANPAKAPAPSVCTAFFFGKPGYLLTAGHCVGKGSVEVHVTQVDGATEIIPAIVVDSSFKATTANNTVDKVTADWALVRLRRLPKRPVEPILLADPQLYLKTGMVQALALGFAADLVDMKKHLSGASQLPQGDFCSIPTSMLRLDDQEYTTDLVIRADASPCITTNGDSGGPLLLWNPKRGRYELLGIASWSDAGKNVEGTDDARRAVSSIRQKIETDWGQGTSAGFAAVQRKIGFSTGYYYRKVRFLLNWDLLDTLSKHKLIAYSSPEYFGALRVELGGVFYEDRLVRYDAVDLGTTELRQLRKHLLYEKVTLSPGSRSQLPVGRVKRLDLADLKRRNVPFETFAPLSFGVMLDSAYSPGDAMKFIGHQTTLASTLDRRASSYQIVVVGGDAFLIDRVRGTVFDVVRQVLTYFHRNQLDATRRHRLYPAYLEDLPDSAEQASEIVAPVAEANRPTEQESNSDSGKDSPKPTSNLKVERIGSLTPDSIPGGAIIQPPKAWNMILGGLIGKRPPPLVLSAIEPAGEPLVPTAVDMSFAARGTSFDDAIQERLAHRMGSLAPSKDTQIIVYCHHRNCWLSYNLALRIIRLGYTKVGWMREGMSAWAESMLPFEQAEAVTSRGSSNMSTPQ